MTLEESTHFAAGLRRTLWTGRILAVGLTLIMAALLGRVIWLKVTTTSRIAAVGDHTSVRSVAPRRGSILDRQGRALAVTRIGQGLYADPQAIEDLSSFAPQVASILGLDPASVDRLLDQRAATRYVPIQPLVTPEQAAELKGLGLRGLGLELNPVRIWPQGSVAAHLIGFVGTQEIGLDGLERALDPVLAGQAGRTRFLRDASGKPLWAYTDGFVPSRDGPNVRLSLDVIIQAFAEEQLQSTCRKFKAHSGQMIVMECKTGQILAMANWPGFDPVDFGKTPPARRRNRCVTDPFEPGSVFKPFIHAAAVAAGLVRYEERLDCSNGAWAAPGGRILHDSHAHQILSWEEVLIQSSNIGMGKGGVRMGARRMRDAVTSFGFGGSSGVGLSGESGGIVLPLKRWNSYSLTSVPMGQEIAVTGIQLVKAFSAFANSGRMVSPSLLAAEADLPVYRRVLTPAVADHTRSLLRRAVTEGTGRRVANSPYAIWGKTGTAQVPDRGGGGYKAGAYIGSFICGAPFDDPRLIVLTVIHEPDEKLGYYGGTVAAPAAQAVLEHALTYLGVGPDSPAQSHEVQLADVD